ncbi:MAG: glutamine--fructose-6-phosphate transaminase (isomerizing) [Polyangia bacterium]
MCGIVGYLGRQQALPVLIEGLKRLEYRGYDSAGLAIVNGHGMQVRKAVGRIAALEGKILPERDTLLHGSLGLAHTRWATHGAPTELNAHPHVDMGSRIAVVHNGIIENHSALRQFLESTGVVFTSQTDTEVLSHLIAYHLRGSKNGRGNGQNGHNGPNGPNGHSGKQGAPGAEQAAAASKTESDGSAAVHAAPAGAVGEGSGLSLLGALLAALAEVVGTFGIAAVSLDHPGTIVAARRGSPLLIGIGNNEYIIASDASAIVAHTSNVIYLEDNEAAEISAAGLRTVTLDHVPVTKTVEQIAVAMDEIELGGYPHRMLKEIFDQPDALQNCLRTRLDSLGQRVVLGIDDVERDLVRTRRFILTGCGTAWHAALVGEYLMEDLARIHTEVEVASELRYRNPIIDELTTLVAVSQSGETADTLAALREVRDKGALTLGAVNVVGSTIARTTDACVYLHVGPEIGVASTKAFTAQVAVLAMLAMWMGRRRHLSAERYAELVEALRKVPSQIKEALALSDQIKEVAKKYCQKEDWLFLGRGYHFPVALEGALKLKEISYIHAEGLSAAEMKHGHIALITDGMPVVVLAPRGSQYDKVLSNIQEVKARGARVIAVGTRGDDRLRALVDDMFEIPPLPEPLQPMVATVPLQLLAYHTAVLRDCSVDRPRNLAKSVTVE